MKINEKIKILRTNNKMSSKSFCDFLKIKEEDLQKYESGEIDPPIELIKKISSLFNLSFEELLNDEIPLHKFLDINFKKIKEKKPKYFGTDGFRGESNIDLTAAHAFKIGRVLGYLLKKAYLDNNTKDKPKVVIGKDTRLSSYMLEYSVASGLSSSGCDAYLLHVTTTPSVSYIINKDYFDAGIMITASHNKYTDNGIKILNNHGEKLDDNIALIIESYMDGDLSLFNLKNKNDLPFAEGPEIGKIIDYSSGRNRYTAYLIALATHSMKQLKIGLDTANGAAWNISKNVFEALGANVQLINNKPNGVNINLDCGSNHIEHLVKFVIDNHLDVGFAFDGDADRCIAVDSFGNVVDGDKIIYLLANKFKRENSLYQNKVVVTVMSNSGFVKALNDKGISAEITRVGDRFVYERMVENGYVLGGEQSGHIIVRKYATTGDGILTAILVCEEMLESKLPLDKLVKDVHLRPQILKNVRVVDKKKAMSDEAILKKYSEINKKLSNEGRVVLRESGTEPVIRVMVELDDEKKCQKYIDEITELFKSRGLSNE